MSAVATADRFVLERLYQPLANAVTRATGKSCYWLAGQSAIAGTLFILTGLCRAILLPGRVPPWLLLLFIAIALLYGRALWQEAVKLEADRSRTRARSTIARTTRQWWIFFLLDVATVAGAWLGGAAPEPRDFLSIGDEISFISFSYFMDCRPAAPVRKTQLASEAA